VFEDTIELWEQMRLGYLHCLEAQASLLRAQRALLCQRALAYSGLRMFHHYRAYRQVPGRDWRALHQVYARAEALGIADAPVKDYLNRDVHDTSPRIAYLRAVLMGICNPNELGPRQLTFVAYLLERWADKVEISSKPIEQEDELPPLAVDLAGERCAERGAAEGAGIRHLDERRLAKSLRNRVGLLRKGESPACSSTASGARRARRATPSARASWTWRRPAPTLRRSTTTSRGAYSASRAISRSLRRCSATRSPPSAASARARRRISAWLRGSCSSTGSSRTRARKA
jgi:hypothetical protein